MTAGSTHTVAVRTDGALWVWGNDGSGQLGDDLPYHTLTSLLIYLLITATRVGAPCLMLALVYDQVELLG